jgi:hypothetical protein
MRKCKSDLNIGKIDNKNQDIRQPAIELLQNSPKNTKIGNQIKIEYDNFSEKPIYIRTDVKSCSNFSDALALSDQVTYIPRKLSNRMISNDIDQGISYKSEEGFDDSSSSS